ncbi:MAG: NAD-dependent epimerase/dehydratase family protein [bacterium]
MKIVITGLAGLIGRRVAEALVRQGHTVLGIDRRPWPDAPPGVEMFRVDVRKRPAEDVFRTHRPEAVIHMATVSYFSARREERYRINLGGTQAVFEYCQRYGVQQALFIGRHTIYGAAPDATSTAPRRSRPWRSPRSRIWRICVRGPLRHPGALAAARPAHGGAAHRLHPRPVAARHCRASSASGSCRWSWASTPSTSSCTSTTPPTPSCWPSPRSCMGSSTSPGPPRCRCRCSARSRAGRPCPSPSRSSPVFSGTSASRSCRGTPSTTSSTRSSWTTRPSQGLRLHRPVRRGADDGRLARGRLSPAPPAQPRRRWRLPARPRSAARSLRRGCPRPRAPAGPAWSPADGAAR